MAYDYMHVLCALSTVYACIYGYSLRVYMYILRILSTVCASIYCGYSVLCVRVGTCINCSCVYSLVTTVYAYMYILWVVSIVYMHLYTVGTCTYSVLCVHIHISV